MSNTKSTFQRSLLASSIAACVLASSQAWAQQALEEVTVTGIRKAQEDAVSLKRDAVQVVDGISAEDIGKLPDVTITDSLQRIPGVSIERSAGEGSTLIVRGLPQVGSLLRFIKKHRIENVVWLTADVHYCAAHYYSPEKAVFKHFEPFWEFVAGPLNAGSFGPNQLDNTFGPEVVFQKAPPVANASPMAGFQFYGDVQIDKYSAEMTVSLKDINGDTVFKQLLEPNYKRRGHKKDWRDRQK